MSINLTHLSGNCLEELFHRPLPLEQLSPKIYIFFQTFCLNKLFNVLFLWKLVLENCCLVFGKGLVRNFT